MGLACCCPLHRMSGGVTNGALNGIQGSNLFERLGRNRRTLDLVNLEELAAGMRPARCFHNVTLGILGVELGKGIGFQRQVSEV